MKNIIRFINDIEQKKRGAFARDLIIIGIMMAYSPYWMKLFLSPDEAAQIANTIVTVGWWILTPGVVFYFFNVWLNYKADKDCSNTSE